MDKRAGWNASQNQFGLVSLRGWIFSIKSTTCFAIECLEKAVELDPLNFNAYQVMARACIAVNRRDDAIEALKKSVKLDNPSDWQLLVELTNSKKKMKSNFR